MPYRFNLTIVRGEIITNFSFVAMDGITGARSVEIATLSVNISVRFCWTFAFILVYF